MNEKKMTPLLDSKIFYGLHFASGIATYQDQDSESYAIYISEKVAKEMDQTFPGKPVFIDHIETLTKETVASEACGYVVESFFNKADGFHWCKFVVTTEEGLRAIEQNKWKLSNAYIPQNFGPGGTWHGTEYAKEVSHGVYEHLAIVQNPRYQESVILTPEQFKQYNEQKESDLKRLANSNNNKGVLSMLNFFKKTKVENGADLESMSVTLPKSKLEVTISKLVNDADEKEMKKNEEVEAKPEHMVKINGEKMTLNDFMKKYDECKNELEELKKKNQDDDDSKENEDEEKEPKENDDDDDSKKNDDDDDSKKNEQSDDSEDKKDNDDDEEEKKKDKKQNNFKSLKNAHKNFEEPTFELSMDQVARGKARYGSGN